MYYFAYGSNLNKAQMMIRCPAATPVGKLILPKARLMFCGVATVEYHDDMSAPGGLWKITKDCEKALDAYEGVRTGGGLYLKEYIKVQVGKKKADVLIYVMNEQHRRTHYALPSSFYLGSIRKGYRDFGLDGAALTRAVEMTREAVGEPHWFDDEDEERAFA